MVCVLKEKEAYIIYIGKRFQEEQKKKKNQIAKKVEKVIPVLTGEEIKRPLDWR